jgi:alpha-glucosidase/oligosaccharide 4-alpha-D-glucosyltransferase
MYDDDGETPEAFEKGKYELLQFASRVSDKELAISIASEAGASYQRQARSLSMVIHNLDAKPDQVEVDGSSVPFEYGAASKMLKFEAAASGAARRRIAIRM